MIFKDNRQTEQEDFDPGFKIPETRGLLGELDEIYMEALREEHREEMEEEDKKGTAKKPRPKKGVICCCGGPGCSIGPMREMQG